MNTFISSYAYIRGPLKIQVNGPKKSILAETLYMLTNFWQEHISTCSVLTSLYDPRQLTENLNFN